MDQTRPGLTAAGGPPDISQEQFFDVPTVRPEENCGETDVRVLATVRGAIDIGYRDVVAEDALCSSADQSHDAMITRCCDDKRDT